MNKIIEDDLEYEVEIAIENNNKDTMNDCLSDMKKYTRDNMIDLCKRIDLNILYMFAEHVCRNID